jgi:LmbE family N-acetylglucosaminyl deacetylase
MRHLLSRIVIGAAGSVFCCIAAGAVLRAQSAPVSPAANAQPLAIDRGSPGLWQDLVRLRTRASLIMFTAHPDDEDGGLLAYESRSVGAETTLFTLNRGEGGQNVMSANFWDPLGLLRTQELLNADRYYGAHQYFSSVADFGFTKTKAEALQKWGYDRVLYDSVRIVRMVRPLVVTSVFSGNVADGHGQHQVAGQMAQEVFRAAADPTVFPDQIRAGLRPWAPLKIYARQPFAPVTDKGVYDYATGNWAPARFRNYVDHTWITGKPDANVQVPEGQWIPAIGESGLQIGRQGLNEQKSQNGGIAIPEPGPAVTGYHRYASRVAVPQQESSFFDGIDVSLAGIAGYAPAAQAEPFRKDLMAIDATVRAAMQSYRAGAPELIAPDLAHGLILTNALVANVKAGSLPEDAKYNILHELGIKQRQFNHALADALGLSLEAVIAPNGHPGMFGYYHGAAETFQTAIPGQQFSVRVHLADQGSNAVQVQTVSLVTDPDHDWKLTPIGAPATGTLEAGQARNSEFAVTVPRDATVTQAYFNRPSIEQPYYNITNKQYLGLPLMPYPLYARAVFFYRGVPITLEQTVQTVQHIEGKGPVENPLIVTPGISVWVTPRKGVLPFGQKSVPLTVTIRSQVKGIAEGTVRLHLPAGWKSTPAQASFHTNAEGSEQAISFEIVPTNVKAESYVIRAEAQYEGVRYTSGFILTGYPGLRPYPYYRDAAFTTTGVDLKIPANLRIGYVTGTGDSVPQSLELLGITPVFLSSQDLAGSDLNGFDAIVLGVRAYAARPELAAVNARLLAYVHRGGTLIVQYNTPEFDHNFGPYPLQLTGNPEKVIDETSKVLILDPSYPALNWPNRITERDFTGWIEERGHGFMHSWDPRYTALTETHDPAQVPQKGGLLVARYGNGFYVYDGYALYRQLPEGVPGAYRIFANLLSLSHNAGMLKLPEPSNK